MVQQMPQEGEGLGPEAQFGPIGSQDHSAQGVQSEFVEAIGPGLVTQRHQKPSSTHGRS